MNNLDFLFHMMIQCSKQLRYENRYADGFAYWKPIKKILMKYDKYIFDDWKVIKKSVFKKIMSLPERYTDGYGNQHIHEDNHFLIQTVRIPSESDNITLRKIVQVAFHIGQYIGIQDESFSWMYLDKYATMNTISEINKIVTKELVQDILTEILVFVPTMEFYIKDINDHFDIYNHPDI